MLAFALAVACALTSSQTFAQQGDDEPLIEPPSGGIGSRFQVVGTTGWTPGETVTLRFLFTTSANPDAVQGAFEVEHAVTVLGDGTWSFPVIVDELFGEPVGAEPGYIVVRAESPAKTAQNAFEYTALGPPPASDVGAFGFGPGAAPAGAIALALFAAAGGAMLTVSGAMRRSVTLK
jgi:hypothetical protein